MMDSLQSLMALFYAPTRGMQGLRDRAPLAAAALFAFIAEAVNSFFAGFYDTHSRGVLGRSLPMGNIVVESVFQALGSVLLVGLILVPLAIFAANLFERRGSFALALQQDYAPAASTILSAWAIASIIAVPLVIVAHTTGLLETTAQLTQKAEIFKAQMQNMTSGEAPPAGVLRLFWQLLWHSALLFVLSPLPFFALWATFAVRVVFRLSGRAAVAVVLLSALILFPLAIVLIARLGPWMTSPFVIILLFFFLRGYVGEIMRGHRARASFKQNLEAATLNPSDASAHYNLGLIHQQRRQIELARARFEKAIEIDAEEIDAHYQLGRIARGQSRLPDAIRHFEEVVGRDTSHSQYEIWREIGATYLEAGQFEDARDALEKFLDHRQSDPEGLYLMGRSYAALGHKREAESSMQACIEAVKTSPAYKYRTEKRWLNEAQQFLRTQS